MGWKRRSWLYKCHLYQDLNCFGRKRDSQSLSNAKVIAALGKHEVICTRWLMSSYLPSTWLPSNFPQTSLFRLLWLQNLFCTKTSWTIFRKPSFSSSLRMGSGLHLFHSFPKDSCMSLYSWAAGAHGGGEWGVQLANKPHARPQGGDSSVGMRGGKQAIITP